MQSAGNAADKVSTSFGQSFDELVSNGKIGMQNNNSSSGVTTMGGSSESSSSSNNEEYDEMDLNRDGQVTLDEIIQYTAMQMIENMQNSADSSTANDNSNENQQKEQSEKFDINSYKHKLATNAYKLGESLVTTAIGVASKSFSL